MYAGLSYVNGIVFHPILVAHNTLHGLLRDFFCLFFGGEDIRARYDGVVDLGLFDQF